MKETHVVPVTKNEKHIVTVEDLTHEGMGVAKIKGYPIFIDNALPGEKVEIKMHKTGKSFGYGKVMKFLSSSKDRVELKDAAIGKVGISPLQHMSYSSQLLFKQNQVKNVMQRIAKMPEVPVAKTLGMKNPWGYRNKAQVPVRKIDDKLVTGFFRKNSHDVIPMENFYIQDPKIDEAILVVRDIMRTYGVKPYNESQNIGNLRHIMVRRGYHTGEMMIVLVTRTPKLFPTSKIIPDILEALPEVKSIVQNVNPRGTNVILGEENIVLYGEDKIVDTIFGQKFEISAKSFYQVNPVQMEVLYQKVLDFAALTGQETVLDLYSGIGTIALTMAAHAKHVYAVEVVPDAVENAQTNAALNNVENVTFDVGLAEEWLPQLAESDIHADVLVVDPPRKGLEKELIEAIITHGPQKMIYVSCNPATLARDVALLAAGGYEVKEMQPVDMFPQTYHVETVVLLEKK